MHESFKNKCSYARVVQKPLHLCTSLLKNHCSYARFVQKPLHLFWTVQDQVTQLFRWDCLHSPPLMIRRLHEYFQFDHFGKLVRSMLLRFFGSLKPHTHKYPLHNSWLQTFEASNFAEDRPAASCFCDLWSLRTELGDDWTDPRRRRRGHHYEGHGRRRMHNGDAANENAENPKPR